MNTMAGERLAFRIGTALLGTAWLLVAGVTASPTQAATRPAGAQVLLVGSWQGVPGSYHDIQKAVDAASPGDWILVGPGDYHAKGTDEAGVLITTHGLHLRGMNQNGVVVDGTNPGGSGPCDASPGAQDFGPPGNDGKPAGRNGIEVFEANGVSVENLTVCNYLASDTGGQGNEIWFNGGDGTGKQKLGAFTGRYLSATSTYYKKPNAAMAKYGIFASNTYGPGLFDLTYASNMGDSAYYVGACPDCNVVLTRGHGENSALAYSGTNSGGHLIIENSEFDLNRTGVVPNSLNNDDQPSPQDGACPNGKASCTFIRNNYIHDNNNPNVPAFGIAGQAAIGAGIEIAGGHNDTIVHNKVVRQGGWGIVTHDFPDSEPPPPGANCRGGMQISPDVCFFEALGNEVASNRFAHNGFFGNPGNVDLGNEAESVTPGNCFHDNVDTRGELTSDPENIQVVDGQCGGPAPGDQSLAAQLLCASGMVGSCPPGSSYPQQTKVKMLPMPKQKTMANPCAGVPANPWCNEARLSGGRAGTTGAAMAGAVLAAAPVRRLGISLAR